MNLRLTERQDIDEQIFRDEGEEMRILENLAWAEGRAEIEPLMIAMRSEITTALRSLPIL